MGGQELLGEVDLAGLEAAMALPNADQRAAVDGQLDVMTCIREKTTLDEAGRLLAANAERHLKPHKEMERLYKRAPGAVAETIRFLNGLSFKLDDLKFNYP
ncbi:MAG: hypothetical protein EOO27_28775, partial [Comamonadaceae bacterium]